MSRISEIMRERRCSYTEAKRVAEQEAQGSFAAATGSVLYPPMRLPDDPMLALEVIAGYLHTARHDTARAIWKDGELVGVWQTKAWFDGLLEIANECDRLLALNSEIGGGSEPSSGSNG